MVFAVLLAQGLRVCLHMPHADNPEHVHTTAVHLENDLALPAEDDDANDQHVALSLALIKKLTDSAAFALLPVTTLLLLLPRPQQRFSVPRDAAPPPSADRRLRPPLRAPPH